MLAAVGSACEAEFSTKSNCGSCALFTPSFDTKETHTSLVAPVLGFVENKPMPLFEPGFAYQY